MDPVTSLLRTLKAIWDWVARIGRRVAHVGTAAAQVVSSRTHTFAINAHGRLVSRWQTDGAYRRTVIAAISAITATLLPHPAAAAAIGALIAERPVRVATRRDPFLDDYDEDEEYSPRRTPLAPWTPGPRRLWDSLE